MRILLGALLVAMTLGSAMAGGAYLLYMRVPEYVHNGALPRPLSASLKDSSRWIRLFNGEDLSGWTPKFVGQTAGINYLETFRVHEGQIVVGYDKYPGWNGEYGHLILNKAYSHYVLRLEYRFFGEQFADSASMGWAWRNSGVMLHSQSADSMALDQDFPVALEAQLLGAADGQVRPTGNLCTPGTHVYIRGRLHTPHCTDALSLGITGDGWVRFEAEVLGNELIRHFINGELVMEYQKPIIDTWFGDGKALARQSRPVNVELETGHIALQSESHPVAFRNIELYPLPH